MKAESSPAAVDDYIAGFPPDVREILQTVRQTIREVAPDAGERISYGVPTFTLNGPLIYFAGYKNHISIYPRVDGGETLNRALEPYTAGKGTYRFPLAKPIPYDLIREVACAHLTRTQQRSKPQE